jgi:RNA polymerase sigma-70 factor (ECF subfamily)
VSSADSAAADDPHVIALVGRAAARDQAAFAELYDRYLDRVYRYIYYRTANRTDAEDLTEQVFLQAWAAIERFRWQGKPFVAWLYTVAHNVVVDWRRRTTPSHSLDDGDHPIHLESPSATQAMSHWIDADLLANAIKQLTPEQQQVITLKFLDGLDTRRIAQIMDKREGTIRALQLRALQSLRRALERQGESLTA